MRTNWVVKSQQTGTGRAERFGNIVRHNDHLTALDCFVEFERSFHKIYPHESELKNEHFDYLEGSFLDFPSSFFSCTYALPS